MGIQVVSDSSCDLTDEVIEKYGIQIVPLTIRFGEEEFVDKKDLTTDEFWKRCNAAATLPETAAPSPGAFQSVFAQAEAGGCEAVVCITISSKLSGTYQSAKTAADTYEGKIPVEVIDSTFVTVAHGFAVLAAAIAASSGQSVEKVAAAATDSIARTRAYGLVETLDNLRKGGRIGTAQAMFGSILSIKPIVEIAGGVVTAESKQRTRSKQFAHAIEIMKAHGEIELLAISDAIATDADAFADQVALSFPGVEIMRSEMGAVLGTHAGPGTVSLVGRLKG